ncbi:MAG: gamma-glutamyltransferase, partial [Cyclobacteriaceae bacterium]|nr:gamma-glutamyltransferase [Cyclobacteriaceae bacterium]
MKKLFRYPGVICIILTLLAHNTLFAQTYARNGMVASSSMIASEIGRDVLQGGGNAIDATVATAFALAVTWPTAGNIGGGGFIVFMDKAGDVTTFDFREKAPLAASADMFLDEKGQLIEGSNHFSALAVGVPGTVAGLFQAHQKYGTLPWNELVQPAVDLAKNGFAFTWTLYHQALNIQENWTAYPDMIHYFRNEKGEIPQPGEIWQQPELAHTLELIRDKGHDGFYKGEVAKKLTKYMKDQGGIINKKDLAKYEAIERQPVKGNYRGYDVYSMPPPSSGGVALVEMLNILENYDLKATGFNSAAYYHLVAEAMRRAFADRAEHLGDPDFNTELPIDHLTSKEYAKRLSASINLEYASVSDSSRFG